MRNLILVLSEKKSAINKEYVNYENVNCVKNKQTYIDLELWVPFSVLLKCKWSEWNGVELYLVTLALLKMRAFLVRKKV